MNSSDENWRDTLIKILEELTNEEYKKMVSLLPGIPGGKKQTAKLKMVDTIIKHFGSDGSIAEIITVMKKIPRNDPTIRGFLIPFVQKLERNKQNPRNKSFEDESPAANRRKRKNEGKLETEVSGPATKKLDTIIPIASLKSCEKFVNKGIQVKVIRISQMISYNTKEGEKKIMFYMGVADDTGSVKITVYGKEKYKNFKEGSCYMLHRVINEENTVKVTSKTQISDPKPFDVPLKFEAEAAILIESPVYSIAEAVGSKQQTLMSIEGFVNEIESKKVTVDNKQVVQRILTVQDETALVNVVLWRELAQLRKALVGDKVRVTNLRINEYYESISLNSTGTTNVIKIQDAPMKTLNMKIISVKGCTKAKVTLVAELDGNVKSFIVSTKLLAQTYDIKPGLDFKKDFLAILPKVVEARVKGNIIKSFFT
ncbi:uncharacterized protein LOC106024795 [Esox lucius]|uniref:uncharacterized protein LOC106024795 n=1 Tax=Esox lucius TaxID=8010 RepID=UPI001477188C|nr:uncharacterized protein LOC106024795 [Esox lucius]XP_012994514.2 uncharacterized protein LOC106024795 [Esox lucius]